MSRRPCSIDGCDNPSVSRGWCNRHYHHWRRHGDPTNHGPLPSVAERFWSKVDRSNPYACWVWLGSLDVGGYSRFNVTHDTVVRGHRFAYEMLVGTIPEGLQLDHLCRNRRCVNPSHLEPVTAAVNRQRAVGVRTHCVAGHELTGENVSIHVNCRTCRRKYTADSRRRAAEARVA